MDVAKVLEDFQDHGAPKLDTYEQAIYLYLFRHTRLIGESNAVIGLKGARKSMAMGVGQNGRPMSEATCYEKLRSLEKKGFVQVISSESKGTRVEVFLPGEIPGLIPASEAARELSLEDLDFFTLVENRELIFEREGGKCFYCLRSIDAASSVIEHVEKRRVAGNGYRNVVAACRTCNNRKGEFTAVEHLRTLYRDGFISDLEFSSGQVRLGELREGRLRPQAPAG